MMRVERKIKYLLRNIPELVKNKMEKGWSQRADKPEEHIIEICEKLRKTSNLDVADEYLDEIIATCVTWKERFVDWETVKKEKNV